MKIFFSASFRPDAATFGFYKTIYQETKKLGYTHIDDQALTLEYSLFVKNMEASNDEAMSYTKGKLRGIQAADICIFEVSHHSLGVGFMIEKALELNKPTIVLHRFENIPYFLSGVDDDKFILVSYTEKTLKRHLKNSLEIARERKDKRFNFFISPKLLEYIEKVSVTDGITKSKFIRNLIVNKMRAKSGA